MDDCALSSIVSYVEFELLHQKDSHQRPAQYNAQHTTHTQHTTHSTQHTTHNTQHTTHNTQHTTDNTQHTTHNTQHPGTSRASCASQRLSGFLKIAYWALTNLLRYWFVVAEKTQLTRYEG